MNPKAAASGLFALLLLTGPLEAGPITTYATPGAFGANDTIDWGPMGPDGTNLGTSAAIAGVVVTSDLDMWRLDEGGGWSGHFAEGEHLLHSGNGASSLRFSFDAPVAGLGFRTHTNGWGAFTATLEVFGIGGSLGSYSVNGFGGLCMSCNDAPFLGISTAMPEIVSAVLTATNDGAGLAIGALSLQTGPVFQVLDRVPDGSPAVPEPSTLALAAIGLGLVMVRRHRRG